MAWQRTSTEGYEAGLPILRRALDVFGIGMSVDEQLRCHWVAGIVARYTSGMTTAGTCFLTGMSSLPAASVR